MLLLGTMVKQSQTREYHPKPWTVSPCKFCCHFRPFATRLCNVHMAGTELVVWHCTTLSYCEDVGLTGSHRLLYAGGSAWVTIESHANSLLTRNTQTDAPRID